MGSEAGKEEQPEEQERDAEGADVDAAPQCLADCQAGEGEEWAHSIMERRRTVLPGRKFTAALRGLRGRRLRRPASGGSRTPTTSQAAARGRSQGQARIAGFHARE